MENIQVIKADLAYNLKAITGEGAIWHPDRNTLFFVDIEGQKLYEYFPKQNRCFCWTFEKMVTTVVPETKNTVIIALQNEIIRFNLGTQETNTLACIDDKNGTLRCNDGKCDPEGRFWFGTMVLDAPPGSASLYTLLHGGKVKEQLNGITISNGIGWSKDERFMFYIDTQSQKIMRYFFDAGNATIKEDRMLVEVPEDMGSPDGMTLDADGNLWVAHWNGYGVYCYHGETGKLLAKIEIPVPNVTSCAFGGEQCNTLFITTARSGLSMNELKKYPLSGSLFVCRPGVCGTETYRFKNKVVKS